MQDKERSLQHCKLIRWLTTSGFTFDEDFNQLHKEDD